MAKQFRKLDQFMASLGDKEATYDAGPAAWTLGAAFQMQEFGDSFVAWQDALVSDEDTVHQSIYPTTDEIIRQDVRFTYAEPRVLPHSLAGWAALAGGVLVDVQDAALTAYRHKITPVGAAVVLPGIAVQEKASGEQYIYKGIKLDRFSLKRGGPNNAYVALEVALIGSGTRATSATAFPAKVSGEVRPTYGKALCWLETGADISIDAVPTQSAENISSGTPDNLTSRLLDFEFVHENDLQADDGYTANSGLVKGRLDHGPRRGARVKLDVIVDETTLAAERAYYDGRANTAVEIEVDSGTIIAATGAMKWGFDLIIPRLRLDPIARGVKDGFNIITFAGRCFDDGTNPLWILYVYDAQATYLA